MDTQGRREAIPVCAPLAASARGFTLLELLISMTLLVLVMVIVIGAIRLGSRSVAAGERKMETQERLRTVLSIIDAQIQSHIPLTYQEEGNKKFYFRGDQKELRFSTNYSIWSGRKGYVIVTYKIEDDPGGSRVLSASEQIPGIEGRRETRLLDASRISFAYYVREAPEEAGKWVESLTDGFSIPEKVKIGVTWGMTPMSLVFPIRAAGRMAVQGKASSLPREKIR